MRCHIQALGLKGHQPASGDIKFVLTLRKVNPKQRKKQKATIRDLAWFSREWREDGGGGWNRGSESNGIPPVISALRPRSLSKQSSELPFWVIKGSPAVLAQGVESQWKRWRGREARMPVPGQSKNLNGRFGVHYPHAFSAATSTPTPNAQNRLGPCECQSLGVGSEQHPSVQRGGPTV